MSDLSSAVDVEALLREREAVLRFAHSVAARHDLAEDLAQDAMVVALSSAGPTRSSLDRWLRGIVRRLAAKGLRTSGRRARREASVARTELAPSAAEVAERIEERQRLLAALTGLAEPYRTVLFLRYFEDLPPRSVAARLGVSVETVRSQVRRGLDHVRRQLVSQRRKRAGAALGFLPVQWSTRAGPVLRLLLRGLAMKTALGLLCAAFLVWMAFLIMPSTAERGAPEIRAVPAGAVQEETGRQRVPRDLSPEPIVAAFARLSGRVSELESGRALEGVVVVLSQGGATRTTRSSSDGAYEFEQLATGSHLLGIVSDTHYLPALERYRHDLAAVTSVLRSPRPPSLLTLLVAPRSDLGRDLELSPGLEVRGHVVGPGDRAVGGATVSVRPPESRSRIPLRGLPGELRLPRSKTDAQGRFVLRGLAPSSGWVAFATMSGYVGVPSSPIRLAPGRPVPEVTLTLVAAASLGGRVVHANGSSVAGVTVELFVADLDLVGGVRTATTDGAGAFAFREVPDGRRVQLTTSIGSRAVVRIAVEALSPGEKRRGVELVVANGADVAGWLVDSDGDPVAGRSLNLTTTRRGGSWIDTVTESDGGFRFFGVPSEEVVIGTRHGRTVFEDLGPPFVAPREDLHVVLPGRLRALRVRVLDPERRPVPQAVLVVNDLGMEMFGAGALLHTARTYTVTHGEAEVSLHARGRLKLFVNQPRDGEGRALGLSPAEIDVSPESADEIEIVLTRGETLVGIVRTEDGPGIVGVHVMAWRKIHDTGPAPESALRRPDVSARTDERGRFSLPGLPAGAAVEVLATAPAGFVKSASRHVTVATGPVEIVLLPSDVIAGSVLHENGSAVTQGRVEAYLARKNLSQPGRLTARVQSDGTFRIEGVPRGVVVRLRAESTEPASRGVVAPAVRAGVVAGMEDLTLRLTGGLVIRGVIVDAAGEPFPDCVVMARIEREQGTYATVEPAADGSFTLPVAKAGVYTLRGMRGSAITSPVRATAPSTGVRLVVGDRNDPNGRPIEGIVRLPDGSPASQGRVHFSWRATAGTHAGRTTAHVGSNGRFVTKLIAADVTVSARVVVEDAEHRSEFAPTTVQGIRPGARNLELVVLAGHVIEGVLLDGKRRPVAGAGVRADPEAANFGTSAWAATRTDDHGRFRLVVGSPGNYDLGAFRKGRRIAGPMRVTAPSSDVTFVIPFASRVDGRVICDDGSVEGVLVRGWSISPRPGRVVMTRTDAHGMFLLEGLTGDGPFVLEVRRLDDVEGDRFARVELSSASENAVLDLRPALEVAGVLHDVNGRPLDGVARRASVTATGSGTSNRAKVDGNGRFRIRGLPAGEYDLTLVSFATGERVETRLGTPVSTGSAAIVWTVLSSADHR